MADLPFRWFDALGIRVAKLDRFISTKDRNNIIKGLASGEIDAVVGTHSLFGLEFKKLPSLSSASKSIVSVVSS